MARRVLFAPAGLESLLRRELLWCGVGLFSLLAGACTSGGDKSPEPTVSTSSPATVQGRAFGEPVTQGISLPLQSGSFGVVGLVALENQTDDDVEILRASPVFVDGNPSVTAISLSPESPKVPLSDRDRHVEGAVPLSERPAVPAGGTTYVITFEVTLPPGASVALVAGLDVHYKANGREAYQRWPIAVLLCGYEAGGAVPPCDTYKGESFDDLDIESILAAPGRRT